MTDRFLLRLCDCCPWAVARLRRRYSDMVRAYLADRLGSDLLAGACLYLTFWWLPQLCGEIQGESIPEFLRLVADVACCDFFNLR